MFTHKIDLMGPEYVLMLGVWWGVTVLLTVLFLALKRVVARWYEHRHDARAATSSLDG